MQKQVSKQSLAIVALSILLAISMALTATFAAFNANAKTVGTIQFAGGVVVTINASTAGGDANIITTNNEFTYATPITTDATANAAQTAFRGITVAMTNGADAYYAVKVSLGGASVGTGAVTVAPKSEVANFKSQGDVMYFVTDAAGEINANNLKAVANTGLDAKAISDLFDINIDANKVTTGGNVTITVEIFGSTTASDVITHFSA